MAFRILRVVSLRARRNSPRVPGLGGFSVPRRAERERLPVLCAASSRRARRARFGMASPVAFHVVVQTAGKEQVVRQALRAGTVPAHQYRSKLTTRRPLPHSERRAPWI